MMEYSVRLLAFLPRLNINPFSNASASCESRPRSIQSPTCPKSLVQVEINRKHLHASNCFCNTIFSPREDDYMCENMQKRSFLLSSSCFSLSFFYIKTIKKCISRNVSVSLWNQCCHKYFRWFVNSFIWICVRHLYSFDFPRHYCNFYERNVLR